MTLGALLTVLDESGLRVRPATPGDGAAVPDTTVASIAYDSRAVSPSALFVALRGAQADGAAFAGQAIARGAAAVVAEAGAPEGCPVPWITVRNGRLALALLAAIALPRPAMITLCGIALLTSLLTPLLATDVVSTRAPLTLFDWRYGHLLNFNGVTHTVLLLWPVAASAWLFVLAGRPGWGAPPDSLE